MAREAEKRRLDKLEAACEAEHLRRLDAYLDRVQQVLDTDEWATWLGVWRRVTVDGPWPGMTPEEQAVFDNVNEDAEAGQLLARWRRATNP